MRSSFAITANGGSVSESMFSSGGIGELSPATVKMYETALFRCHHSGTDFSPPRYPVPRVTLTHGDCYLGQFLCPRNPKAAPTYIVDFGDVSGNFGPYDLVYAFCTFWTRDQRRESGHVNTAASKISPVARGRRR